MTATLEASRADATLQRLLELAFGDVAARNDMLHEVSHALEDAPPECRTFVLRRLAAALDTISPVHVDVAIPANAAASIYAVHARHSRVAKLLLAHCLRAWLELWSAKQGA
jgi:hypothetical protein